MWGLILPETDQCKKENYEKKDWGEKKAKNKSKGVKKEKQKRSRGSLYLGGW